MRKAFALALLGGSTLLCFQQPASAFGLGSLVEAAVGVPITGSPQKFTPNDGEDYLPGPSTLNESPVHQTSSTPEAKGFRGLMTIKSARSKPTPETLAKEKYCRETKQCRVNRSDLTGDYVNGIPVANGGTVIHTVINGDNNRVNNNVINNANNQLIQQSQVNISGGQK